MDKIIEIISWFTANYETIFVNVGAIVTACSALVALSPSTKDDEILGKIVKFFELFSIFNKKTK